MPDLRAKALAYLRDAKVAVIYARTAADERRPHAVVAIVQGHTGAHVVSLDIDHGKGWLCTCNGAKPDVHDSCAHTAAVQLVTNHPSPAER